jgi:ferric-dicitrate binding protein FerR (iron transport regulator)
MDSNTGKPGEELIARYLAGQAIDAELREIEKWASESDTNSNELESFKKTWEISGQFETNTSYDVDQAWLKVKSKMGNKQDPTESESQKTNAKVRTLFSSANNRNWWAIAAGLILLAGLYFVFFQPAKDDRLAKLNKEVRSDFEALEVVLPDSSHVILKPNSILRYSSPFQPDERSVVLIGSAHFDVRKNPSRPFSIAVGSCFVKVLGTSFFIDAPAEKGEILVSVETGKVLFSTKQMNQPASDGSSVILLPGYRGQFQEGKKSISLGKVDPVLERYAFDQTIIFSQTDLQTVCELLGKIFNKNISLAHVNLKNCLLTANFKGQNLEQILGIISETFGLSVTENREEIIIDGEGCL